MELADKLREIMKQEFGIVSDRQLMDAVDGTDVPDAWIFTVPLEGEANAKKTA